MEKTDEKRNKALGHVYVKKKNNNNNNKISGYSLAESLFTRKTEMNGYFYCVFSLLNVFSCCDKIIMSNRHKHAVVEGFPI